MRSAALRHRVTIQVNSPSTSSYGVRTPSWATLETVYAGIYPISGSEQLRAGRRIGEVTHRFVMRYRSDFGTSDVEMSPKYRLSYDSRTFEVLSVVDVDERHRELEVMAREVV